MEIQTLFQKQETKNHTYSRHWWVYGFLALIMLFLLFAGNYGFAVGQRMTSTYAPMVEAAMEIKLQTTTGHLWLEEIISGDRFETFDVVMMHFEKADWYARAMLEGAQDGEKVYLPLEDLALREEITQVRKKLDQFKKITHMRWQSWQDSGVGTEIDQQYDALFRNFLGQAELVDMALQAYIRQDVRTFAATKKVLFLICILLTVLVGIVFFRLERQRALDFFTVLQANRQSEAGERLLKTTLRSLGDALVICDVQGRVVYLNPVASHLTGWSLEEAAGEKLEEVFNIVNEFTRKSSENPVKQVIKKKLVVGLANHTLLLSRDGNEYPIEDSGAPIIDDNENLRGVVLVFRDVTERRNFERALLKSKKEWEDSFDALEDIMTIHDMDMRIVRANKAAGWFFGKEPKDLVGKRCYEVFRGATEPCAGCPELATITDRQSHSQLIKHKNLEKTFHVTSSPILDQEGNLVQLVHIAKDVTEQIKLEDELFQSRKMEAIGTLAGGIAHDFNNILSAILGYAELAKEDLSDEKQVQEDLDEVIKGAHRASELVKQILTFSRKGGHNLEPLFPHLIVKETLKLLRASLPTSIRIEEDIDTKSGKIMADPTKLQQVMVNLCTNALHAMENEQGKLIVKLVRKELDENDVSEELGVSPGNYIELTVSDTGHGMERTIMERVFEPYFTTKDQGKGTGIGLSVVHGIVQDYGGMIKMESVPNQGSTFRVYFAALQEDEEEMVKTKERKVLPTGNERILLVDDESMIVGVHKSSLERLGYQVTASTNSLEALQRFREDPRKFDVVVTDQTMPNLTGIELARTLLAIKSDLPIILCTGYSSQISEEKAREIGIREFALKPVAREKLAVLVRAVLDG